MACLITGGAGFIGAHLLRSVLNLSELSEHEVVVLDDLSGGYRTNLCENDRMTFVEGSVTDSRLVEELFSAYRFEYVYHLAAYAAEGLSHYIRRFNYTNNLIGSTTLINASVRHGTKCLVFTSSIAVYGSVPTPMREDAVCRPEDPYGIAKYAVELDLGAAHDHFGLDYVVFRPHNVYGEFQNIGDRYRNVVGIFMNHLLQGRPMPVFGDGTQQRAFTYVGDIAATMARAPLVAEARNQIFNVGAETPISVNELAQAVAQAMGSACDIEYVPARREVAVAYACHEAADRVFGISGVTSLPDGLAKMARWVRRVGARETPEFTEIEVRKGLPVSWQEKTDQ